MLDLRHTSCESLAVRPEFSGAVDQASPTQAQCCLPVQPAGLGDSGSQRQTRVRHTGVLLSVLSQGVTQILGEGQSEGTECEDRRSSTGQDLHTSWLLACCG